MPERCKTWKTIAPFPTLHTALWETPVLLASPTFPPLSAAGYGVIDQGYCTSETLPSMRITFMSL